MRSLPAVLAVALLAGCTAPSGPAPSGVPTESPFLSYRGCVEHQWFGATSPGADPAAYLPEGFTFGGLGGLGVAGSWSIFIFACDDVVRDGTSLGPSVDAAAALFALPPDDLAITNDSRVGGYGLFLFQAATNPAVVAQYQAWGLPAVLAGDGALGLESLLPGLATGEGRIEAAPLRLTDRVVEEGTPAAWDGRFVRIFAVGGELRPAPVVTGLMDVWVPSREIVEDAVATYQVEGLTGAAADLLPSGGPAQAVGWRMPGDAVSYEMRYVPLA